MKPKLFLLHNLFLFLCACILIAITGCNKPDATHTPITDTTIVITPIPPPEFINTSVTAYILDNDQASIKMYVNFGQDYLTYSDLTKGFTSGAEVLNRYQAKIGLDGGNRATFYSVFKTWPSTNSIRNYIDLKLIDYTDVGTIATNQDDASFTLPGNGLIKLPPNSLYNNTGSFPFYIAASYLKQSDNDYAVRLPSYPMADDNNKRWFLNSYGMYLIEQKTNQYLYNSTNFQGTDVLLKIPIPQGLLKSAPDSIAVWNMNNDTWVWQKSGFAHKLNGYYEKIINRMGFWNFAIPETGAYISLQLRTTTDCGIPNTRFKIKNGEDEIADQRTDADGNATVFVPIGKNLTIDFIQDHYGLWTLNTIPRQSLGNFNSAVIKKVILNDRPDLASLEGNVFNCDGTAFKDGIAMLTNTGARDKYIIPIKNGHFKTASWINYGYNLADLDIIDVNGGSLVNYKILMGSGLNGLQVAPGILNHKLNFYTCANATKVYCNYKIDTTGYTISGDETDANIKLTETDSVPGDIINITTIVNHAFVFQGYFRTVLGNYFNNGGTFIPTGLKVNGIDCEYSPNAQSEIAITRRDPVGGYMEGWFNIYYTDNNNASHSASGNFRVRRAN